MEAQDLVGYRSLYASPLTRPLIIAGLMTLSLTGCRFGDYTSSAAPVADPVTGYYDAHPSSLSYCATGTASQCVAASTTQIPAFIANEITQPVALILQDASTGDAVFTDSSGAGTTALPVWVGSDNVTLYYANSTSASTLWKDPSCTTTLYLSEDGQIVPGGGHAIAGTTGRTVGSVTLKVEVVQTFDGINGSCTAELQSMSSCYQDVNQCGGADHGTNVQLQAKVQSLLGAYLQAGAMTAADIPHLVNIAYEVHYQ